MSARAMQVDIASAGDVGALVEALAARLGPGVEVVIRRVEAPTQGAVIQAGDPLRTSARRVVDLLGVPSRVVGHRCLVEALVLMAPAWPRRPAMECLCLDVARRCCRSRTASAGEKAMRYAIHWAFRLQPDRAAAILAASSPRHPRSVGSVLCRLMSLVQDDLAQGDGH